MTRRRWHSAARLKDACIHYDRRRDLEDPGVTRRHSLGMLTLPAPSPPADPFGSDANLLRMLLMITS
jgi:hypothetical protein